MILSVGAGAYLLGVLRNEDAVGDAPLANKQLFLPGKTSHGHHQIELACEACHKDAFAGREGLQKACVECHGAELQEANDSHPKRLFTDPRNADMLAKIAAAECVACHVEHKPEITQAVGVTVPQDHCMVCHRDIAEERFTHKNLKPESCAAAGCHNYHDNRALYEEFLLKHLREPALLDSARVRPRDFTEQVVKIASYPAKNIRCARCRRLSTMAEARCAAMQSCLTIGRLPATPEPESTAAPVISRRAATAGSSAPAKKSARIATRLK